MLFEYSKMLHVNIQLQRSKRRRTYFGSSSAVFGQAMPQYSNRVCRYQRRLLQRKMARQQRL